MSYVNEDGTLMRDDGKFRCQACLDCKPMSDLSEKDARYCTFCQPIIEYEYSLLSSGSHSKRYQPIPLGANSTQKEAPPVYMDTGKDKEVLLHTKLENTRAYQNPTQTPIINLGGRPRKDIPIDLIHKLSKQGLGVREIVRKLKEYKLSAMSVSRVLSGERN